MERVVGEVVGEGEVAFFVTMRMAGEERAREVSSPPGRFHIVLENGAEVEVRCERRPRLGPLR